MDIADTLSTDFRDAVRDAEKSDMATIESILQEMNLAYTEYSNKEALLNTKSEQALRTMEEISDLRDVNTTTYERRIAALREQLTEFKETKATKATDSTVDIKGSGNVVKIA
jgi:hypothetical protein